MARMAFPIFLLLFAALAAPHLAVAAEPLLSSLQNLASGIKAKERSDEDLIAKLLTTWKQKCAKSEDPACALSESDIYPGGSADRVLLFRGENKIFELPAAAPATRALLAGSAFCSAPCSYDVYSSFTRTKLQELLRVFKFRETGRSFPVPLFDERAMSWGLLPSDLPKGNGPLPSLAPLPLPQPGDKEFSPLELMTTHHFTGDGVNAISKSGRPSSEFNPFVSFSLNPRVAVHFSQLPISSPSDKARIFILSVPKSELPAPADCHSWLAGAGKLMNLSECNFSDDFSEEIEFDVVFTLDSGSIKDVLLTPANLVRVPTLN